MPIVGEGGYVDLPLEGIMHDQMRENIDFEKGEFIPTGPIAPVYSTTELDHSIRNETDVYIHNHHNRLDWDRAVTTGSYPWKLR
jgi:hypothetical protein